MVLLGGEGTDGFGRIARRLIPDHYPVGRVGATGRKRIASHTRGVFKLNDARTGVVHQFSGRRGWALSAA